MSDPTQGATSITFDELEQQNAAADAGQQQADLGALTVDGQDIPEHLRGKSVKDLIAAIGAREEALRLSEAARLQSATPAPPAPVAPPPPEPELTDEQIAQMHEENPLKAIEAISDRAVKRAERNLEARLGPLVNGTASQVEAAIRAKYPDEFALFGQDITNIAANVPNAKAVLSDPTAWEQLIALARGRPGNFERLLEHKMNKSGGVTRQIAQQQQQDSVGFSDHSGGRGRAPTTVAGLDPIQREIAEKMGLTPEDYVKWSKIS